MKINLVTLFITWKVILMLPIEEGRTYIPRELFDSCDPKDLMKYGIRKWPDGKAVEINVGIGSRSSLLVPIDKPITYQGPNWYVEGSPFKAK